MVPNVTKFGDMKGFSFYPILVSPYLLYILYVCHNILYFLSVSSFLSAANVFWVSLALLFNDR